MNWQRVSEKKLCVINRRMERITLENNKKNKKEKQLLGL